MTEPTSSTFIATSVATGLTVFGVATGLQPELLIAGMVGGLWSQTTQESVSLPIRAFNAIISSLVSAYAAPFIAGICMWFAAKAGISAEYLLYDSLSMIIAVAVGLLIHNKILGPAVLKVIKSRLDKLAGDNNASS